MMNIISMHFILLLLYLFNKFVNFLHITFLTIIIIKFLKGIIMLHTLITIK